MVCTGVFLHRWGRTQSDWSISLDIDWNPANDLQVCMCVLKNVIMHRKIEHNMALVNIRKKKIYFSKMYQRSLRIEM